LELFEEVKNVKIREYLLHQQLNRFYISVLYRKALESKAEVLLELGVEEGVSTIALLSACSLIEKAHLWSVDLAPCLGAKTKISELGLESFWTFTQIDDLEYAKTWNKPIDFLFVDTSHEFAHTKKEIERYSPYIRKGGVIFFHDINRHGVARPIYDCFGANPKDWTYETILKPDLVRPYPEYGLGVLKRD